MYDTGVINKIQYLPTNKGPILLREFPILNIDVNCSTSEAW